MATKTECYKCDTEIEVEDIGQVHPLCVECENGVFFLRARGVFIFSRSAGNFKRTRGFVFVFVAGLC